MSLVQVNVALHVELCGYPGAGKTTVAQRLHETRGVRLPKLASTTTLVRSHPLKALALLLRPRILATLLTFGSRGARDCRKLARTAIRQTLARTDLSEPAVLDEGVVHDIWKVLYANPAHLNRRWWRAFLRYACPVVVVLEVSPQHARDAMRAKPDPGRINRALIDADLDSETWRDSEASLQALLDVLDAQNPPTTVRLNTADMTLTETCDHIAAWFPPGAPTA